MTRGCAGTTPTTARAAFCGECGASLFWRAQGRATISIAAGTLDQPTGLKTVAHIYTRDHADYYEIDGPAERFAAGLPAG